MARPDKVAQVEEVRDRFAAATATVLTEYRGLSVDELARLRAELRTSEAEYKVVKNTLTRIAARDAGFDIPDELLTGPTALTFCAGDPVAAAKALRAFSREHPALVVKGGLLEGRLLDSSETLGLADLESREELLAKLAGMFETVIAQPARLAQANLSKAVRLIAALHAKRAERGETAEAETAEAPGEPAAEPDSPPVQEQVAAVDDTPEPDSPAAEAVTDEARSTPDVDATPEDAPPVSKRGADTAGSES